VARFWDRPGLLRLESSLVKDCSGLLSDSKNSH
jgi:hypothetical protein